MTSKRKADDYPLPEGLDAPWQRLGLIMYNDHNADPFHDASQKVIGKRFIDWYKAQRSEPGDDSYTDKEDDDEDDDKDDESSGERSDGLGLGLDGTMRLELGWECRFAEPDNVVVDCMYAVPYIMIRCKFVLPTEHERTIVLSFANSKRYELQVAEERLSGQLHGSPSRRAEFDQQIESLRKDATRPDDQSEHGTLSDEQAAEYKRVLLGLRCDKVGTAYACSGNARVRLAFGQKTTPKSRCAIYSVDDRRAFLALINHDQMAPEEQAKWEAFWKRWQYDDSG